MKITVAIPTYRRGPLLRTALESVRNQSRTDLIAEVIVSENSTDSESLRVVGEFADLPIRHIFQDPPTDSGSHFAKLVTLARTEWIALLGDDDMWGRYHLEDAARGLSARPDAVACAAQFVCTTTDARTARGGSAHLLTEHLAGCDRQFRDFWTFDAMQMGVESLLLTPFNMWGLVGRRAALARAFTAFSEPGAGYDSDRYMFWLLAREGPVAIGREVGLFYRFHPDNACARFLRDDFDYQMKMAGEYTSRIIRAAADEGLPLKQAWLSSMRAMPPDQRKEYWQSAMPGPKSALLQAWGADVEALLPKPAPYTLRQFMTDLSPPLLWRSASRMKRWVLGRSRRAG